MAMDKENLKELVERGRKLKQEKNLHAAKQTFWEAMRLGCHEAKLEYGYVYYEEKNVDKVLQYAKELYDEQQYEYAIELFCLASDMESFEAAKELVSAYKQNIMVERINEYFKSVIETQKVLTATVLLRAARLMECVNIVSSIGRDGINSLILWVQHGHIPIMVELAYLYEKGIGVQLSDFHAHEMYEKAAQLGCTEAQRRLKEIVNSQAQGASNESDDDDG